jgi:U6 snRNA-associated Sm-like protein LSm3
VQAYDGHMNMVLSEVEETIYVVDQDEATGENVVRVRYLPLHYPSAQY